MMAENEFPFGGEDGKEPTLKPLSQTREEGELSFISVNEVRNFTLYFVFQFCLMQFPPKSWRESVFAVISDEQKASRQTTAKNNIIISNKMGKKKQTKSKTATTNAPTTTAATTTTTNQTSSSQAPAQFSPDQIAMMQERLAELQKEQEEDRKLTQHLGRLLVD